jgi:hypothetical protein
MRLGHLEQAILLACLAKQADRRYDLDPDLYRDELPGLLWGWRGVERCRSRPRPYHRMPQTYRGIPLREYRRKQAALTRALATLYGKNLIDAGSTHSPDGLTIYSAKRAAALGRAPAVPLTRDQLRERITPVESYGLKPWTRQGAGYKPRHGRNIKSIRLTSAGQTIALQLKVKSQS